VNRPTLALQDAAILVAPAFGKRVVPMSSVTFRVGEDGSLITYLFPWGSTFITAGAFPHKAALLLDSASRDQWIARLTSGGALRRDPR
jgi:hypothetical protein